MEITRKLNGKQYKLTLKTKKIDDLMFNPFNTRIYDLIKTNKDLESFEMTSDGEALRNIQGLIYEKLKKNFEISENLSIVESIMEDNVQEKMIALPNGLLLSGNNRLSIIKGLKERNKWIHSDQIEIFELENDIDKEEILLIELELQNVQSKQLMYDVINNIRRAKQLLDNHIPLKRVQTLTNLTNFNLAYIEGFDNSIIELSRFYEVDNIIEKIEDLKIYSFLDLFTTTMNSSKVKNNYNIAKSIKNIFFEIMLLSKIPILDFRYVLNGILKKETSDASRMFNEFEMFTHSIFGALVDEFIKEMDKDSSYNLTKFKNDNLTEIKFANDDFENYINSMQVEIRSDSKSVASSKKNIFDIKVSNIPKTEINLEKAKKLIIELEEWIK